ncbi:MAG: NAD(P)-binding domain-containing protein [Alphaproteobacteria bacterium]|nr:NAD(P)-binding domain-containing protein [Alphaproteobacteria bacterium]
MIFALGVIGTGHLAGFVVEGLRKAGWEWPIHAASRDRERLAAFCERYAAVPGDNPQEVIDASDAVLVAVRPDQAEAALSGLKWREAERLVSAMAGVKLETLAALAPGAEIARIMPISSAALCLSPTPFYPASPEVESLIGFIGKAIPMPSEEAFEAATANAAAYGWYFALMAEMIAANEAAGLDPETAKAMAVETLASAAQVALAADAPAPEILKGLRTPGGITEQGLDLLDGADALTPWRAAFAAVADRLRRG